MRLLILTQKADRDDAVLGFFHKWVEEFAKNCESVSVICLEEGRHEFPENVNVYPLGKVKGTRSNFWDRLKYNRTFFELTWKLRKNYDTVLVHMNPIYLAEAGWLWKLMDKKIGLWYTHRTVDMKLRVAERFANTIFTAAKQSFTLKSDKVEVVGHGIDVASYANMKRLKPLGTEPISILTVSRITPIKDPIVLIEAAKILKEKWSRKFKITFIGSPMVAGDGGYSKKVHDLVEEYGLGDVISFAGDVNTRDMPAQYTSLDLAVNMTPTGGLDKVVFESMAAGVPVISSNTAFREYFGTYADRLIFEHGNANDLAAKIMSMITSSDIVYVGKFLQETALRRADLSVLIRGIIERLS